MPTIWLFYSVQFFLLPLFSILAVVGSYTTAKWIIGRTIAVRSNHVPNNKTGVLAHAAGATRQGNYTMHNELWRGVFFSQGEEVTVTMYRDRVEDDPNLFHVKFECGGDSWAEVLRMSKPMDGRLDYRPVLDGSDLLVLTVLANGNPYMTFRGRIFMAFGGD